MSAAAPSSRLGMPALIETPDISLQAFAREMRRRDRSFAARVAAKDARERQ